MHMRVALDTQIHTTWALVRGAMNINGGILESVGVGRQKQSLQRSRSRARAYLLSRSLPPLPPSSMSKIEDSVHLPTLTPHKPHLKIRDSPTVALSVSEPSLFTSESKIDLAEGFPQRRRPILRKSTPQLSLCKLYDPHTRSQSCRPAYTHFSFPIRPSAKLVSPSLSRGLSAPPPQCGVRRLILAAPLPMGTHQGALSVRGTPCLQPQPAPQTQSSSQGRAQLHVFLPTESAPLEVDSESVDEGFMDELDTRVTSLKIQQGSAKASVK